MQDVKTEVQVVQELLALVTARYEKTQQEGKGRSTTPVTDDPEQKKIVQMLMDELSLYGDAVTASVDKAHPYFSSDHHDPELFQDALQALRSQSNEMPESIKQLIDRIGK